MTDRDPFTGSSGAKKRRKKSNADSAEPSAAQPSSAGAPAKKVRRRKGSVEARSEARRAGETKPGQDEENVTPMIIGAVVIAVVAVFFSYWWSHRDGQEGGAGSEATAAADRAPRGLQGQGLQGEAPPAGEPSRREPPRQAAQRPEPPGAVPAPPDVAAPPANASRTASGLASRVLQPGSGTEHPTATSQVQVHYTGWTTDGRMFDSSVARGRPATFPLNRVIAGWTEGVQLMVVGEKRRFWIPENLAYQGRPGPPAGMLVFDVELLQIDPAGP